jgi:hypothetical protein
MRHLALAHKRAAPGHGSPVARVIHNFGRPTKVDRDALARLVSSISRFLEPERAVAAAAGAEVEILDSRRLGVPGHQVGARRLIGGSPPSALWRR